MEAVEAAAPLLVGFGGAHTALTALQQLGAGAPPPSLSGGGGGGTGADGSLGGLVALAAPSGGRRRVFRVASFDEALFVHASAAFVARVPRQHAAALASLPAEGARRAYVALLAGCCFPAEWRAALQAPEARLARALLDAARVRLARQSERMTQLLSALARLGGGGGSSSTGGGNGSSPGDGGSGGRDSGGGGDGGGSAEAVAAAAASLAAEFLCGGAAARPSLLPMLWEPTLRAFASALPRADRLRLLAAWGDADGGDSIGGGQQLARDGAALELANAYPHSFEAAAAAVAGALAPQLAAALVDCAAMGGAPSPPLEPPLQ